MIACTPHQQTIFVECARMTGEIGSTDPTPRYGLLYVTIFALAIILVVGVVLDWRRND